MCRGQDRQDQGLRGRRAFQHQALHHLAGQGRHAQSYRLPAKRLNALYPDCQNSLDVAQAGEKDAILLGRHRLHLARNHQAPSPPLHH